MFGEHCILGCGNVPYEVRECYVRKEKYANLTISPNSTKKFFCPVIHYRCTGRNPACSTLTLKRLTCGKPGTNQKKLI